jgi:hypothetical protein
MNLSELEAAVLDRIASTVNDIALRRQISSATLLERTWTVVGCYTKFILPKDAPVIDAEFGRRGPLDGPWVESAAIENSATTLLWFEDGKISLLEMAACGSFFPEDHAKAIPFKLVDGLKK